MLHIIIMTLLLLAPMPQTRLTCTTADIASLDAATVRALDGQFERVARLTRLMDGFAPEDSDELVYWSFTAEAALIEASATYPDCLLPLVDAYEAVIDDVYAIGAILLWRTSNDNEQAIERMHIAWDARLMQATLDITHWQRYYSAYERLQ